VDQVSEVSGKGIKTYSMEEVMKKLQIVFVAVLVALATKSMAQENAPLRLIQRIPAPGVRGTWDHFGVDLPGNRLFLAATGTSPHSSPAGLPPFQQVHQEGLVEVFDLNTNKLIHTITGLAQAHSFTFRPDINKIFVVDGDASEVKVYAYDSYKLTGHIQLSIDADVARYDPDTKLMYVVNGGREAHTPYCLLSVIDTDKDQKLADIKFDVNRLEGFQMERTGPRLFINMTGGNEIGVFDRQKRALNATWPITGAKTIVPMALDEDDHRLIVAARAPSTILVFDTDTGKQVATLPSAADSDDIFYDRTHKRIYNVCEEGFVVVYEQRSPDDYKFVANVPTRPFAKNGVLVPELNRLYVAAPQPREKDEPAEVLVYELLP
jgi:DNA-binding beta-propeller fold protein YncE